MRVGTMGVAAMMLLGSVASGHAAQADAQAAFERLKALNGEWQGHLMTEDGPEIAVSYSVTGA